MKLNRQRIHCLLVMKLLSNPQKESTRQSLSWLTKIIPRTKQSLTFLNLKNHNLKSQSHKPPLHPTLKLLLIVPMSRTLLQMIKHLLDQINTCLLLFKRPKDNSHSSKARKSCVLLLINSMKLPNSFTSSRWILKLLEFQD